MEPHREIQAVLGKGGLGVTYVAYDWTLKRHMAIKELLPDTIATRVDGSTVVAMGPAQEECRKFRIISWPTTTRRLNVKMSQDF